MKIKTTKNTQLQKAEVAKYLDNYDEAQKIYEKEGMDDLANEMKTNLGQWDKIVNDLEQKCNNNNTNKKMSKEEKEEHCQLREVLLENSKRNMSYFIARHV